MQQLRNLPHIIAFADQFQNFKFAIAQSLHRVGLSFGLAMRELCDHLRCHCWAEVGSSAKDFANCLDHIGHRFMFHDIALCAGAQRAQCVERFIVHRKDQNRQLRKFCPYILD